MSGAWGRLDFGVERWPGGLAEHAAAKAATGSSFNVEESQSIGVIMTQESVQKCLSQ